MVTKSNTKLVIFISFSIVLLLLVALVAIAIKSISDNQQQVLHLKNDSEIESLVYDMRDAAHKRSLIIFRMTATDDAFDREDLHMEFHLSAQGFIKAREILQNTEFDSGIKQFLNKALASAGPGAEAQHQAIDLMIENNDTDAARIALTENVIPIQKQVMGNLTQLLDVVRVNIGLSINDLSSKNTNSILIISILGIIAVILGILIGRYVIKHTEKSEQAFVEQKEIAEQANNAKSMFLANMSHEIRSPLTAIIGFSNSILHRDLNDEKKQELTRSIVRNSKHLHQIINDILDLSKIEAGQLDIEKIPTAINVFFSELQSMVSLQTAKKGLDFNIHYNFPLPENISTDPTRLKQILVNLTNNATKFTQKGYVTVHVSYDADTDKLHFSVSDSGIGMTDEQANGIFSAFSQADSSTTRKFGGTGLGLSISKQLTENLGGEICCQSAIGKGSTFTFFIDAGCTDDTPMLLSKDELKINLKIQQIHNAERLKGHVLLAEDTIDNQDLIKMYVEDTGAKITIVDNGKLAVEACLKERFDLILMDMQMPIMDGTEAIIKIRETNIKTPIISLTANAMKSDVDKCFNAGANKFLTKPIDLNRFNQLMSKYLSKDDKKVNLEITQKKKSKAEKMERLVNRFLDDLPRRLKQINDFNQDNNWNDVMAETHKLKGLGTTMGFPEITALCEEINVCCSNETFKPIPDLVEKLNNYTKSIL